MNFFEDSTQSLVIKCLILYTLSFVVMYIIFNFNSIRDGNYTGGKILYPMFVAPIPAIFLCFVYNMIIQ